MEITKQQYEYALGRIEELLQLVTDETPTKTPLSLPLFQTWLKHTKQSIIPLPSRQ